MRCVQYIYVLEFATDIKGVYPAKKVTLLHSRLRLLPRFDEKMHEESELILSLNVYFVDDIFLSSQYLRNHGC